MNDTPESLRLLYPIVISGIGGGGGEWRRRMDVSVFESGRLTIFDGHLPVTSYFAMIWAPDPRKVGNHQLLGYLFSILNQ